MNQITKDFNHLGLHFSPRTLSTIAGVFLSFSVSAQTGGTVQGTVLDADGQPVIGATIQEVGSKDATVTDLDGHFTIHAAKGSTLHVTYVGSMPQDVKVNGSTLSVQLKNDNRTLDDVVVIGYGVQQKKLVTGATVQVKGDDIAKLGTVNPLTALQSSTPGVQLTQNSGMPGQGYKVYIRGIGTTGGSAPLVLIDGISGDLNDLNPADIESVDVLKDAATAAIYGSRAANGVILVTTKQGKAGKTQISYDGYMGWQNVYKMPDLLNAQQYAMIMNEERYMDGLEPYDFASLVPDWDKIESGEWKGTNWMEEIRNKNAAITNHTLNITGGNDKDSYSAGLSYTYQDGILGKPCQPNFTRYTARMNSDHVLMRTKSGLDLLSFGERATYTFSKNRGIAMGDNYSNNIRDMLRTSPFLHMYDADGNYHYAIPWEQREPNPVALIEYNNGQNKTKGHTLHAQAYITLQPIKNLKFKSDFGIGLYAYSYRSYQPKYKLTSANINDQDVVNQTSGTSLMWKWENTANYIFDLNNKHHFDVLLGQSLETNGLGDSMDGTNTNSIFNDFRHAYLCNTPIVTSRTTLSGYPEGKSTLASFFGRVNYDYLHRYMASFVLRADGSSIFAKGHRWGYFPSVSAGWVITEEKFMQGTSSWLDFLKIRGSWGQNGNQDIAGYQFLSTYSFTDADYTFGPDKSVTTTGAYADILANPDITWETSEQTDLGFDARFLGGRLGLNFDYYSSFALASNSLIYR